MSDGPTDEEIQAEAEKLRANNPELGLVDAMTLAESRLSKRGIDTHFTLELELKPKTAKWVRAVFAADQFRDKLNLTIEERLSNFLAGELNKIRGANLARFRAQPNIGKDSGQEGVVTLPNSVFMDQAPNA